MTTDTTNSGAAAKLTIDNAPVGTKAPAIMGGHWYRTERGWKWNGPEGNGGVFPRPGGDWNGKLIAPAAATQATSGEAAHLGRNNGTDCVELPAPAAPAAGYDKEPIKQALGRLLAAWHPAIASGEVVQSRKQAESELWAAIDAALAAAQAPAANSGTATTADGDYTFSWKRDGATIRFSYLAPTAKAEPIGWEYRHYDSDRGWGEWERVRPRNPHTDTVDDRVAEIREYIKMGYKYELRALYTASAAQADDVRDAVINAQADAIQGFVEAVRECGLVSSPLFYTLANGCIENIRQRASTTSAAPADKEGE